MATWYAPGSCYPPKVCALCWQPCEQHPAVQMEIHTLEALSDNYMYLIVDASTRAGAVVDPADPDVVMEAVQRLGVNLTHVLAILLTRAFPGPPYCTRVRTGFLLTDS